MSTCSSQSLNLEKEESSREKVFVVWWKQMCPSQSTLHKSRLWTELLSYYDYNLDYNIKLWVSFNESPLKMTEMDLKLCAGLRNMFGRYTLDLYRQNEAEDIGDKL